MELNTCKQNHEIYRKIAAELRKAGFERSHTQYNKKIKKLKAEYRKVKDKRNSTGEGIGIPSGNILMPWTPSLAIDQPPSLQ